MDKNKARSLFMDYMYNELEPARRAELEQFLAGDPELKAELDDLMGVRQMLTHLPVEDPEEQLLILEPRSAKNEASWMERLKQVLSPANVWAKTAYAGSFFLLLFIFAGAVSGLKVSVADSAFTLSFGEQTEVNSGISPDQVEYMLNEVKRENALMMAELIQSSQEQQELQFQRTLSSFADYMNDQRNSDLQLLSSGISSLERSYYDRFQQTDQVLGEIIQTVSSQN